MTFTMTLALIALYAGVYSTIAVLWRLYEKVFYKKVTIRNADTLIALLAALLISRWVLHFANIVVSIIFVIIGTISIVYTITELYYAQKEKREH